MDREKEIVAYLQQEFDPEVILLAGSRARGKGTSTSDWDLFLLGAKNQIKVFKKLGSEMLDIAFKDWPENGKALTIPYGPLWPVKVLLDKSGGKLEALMAKTEADSQKGPLDLYREAVFERLDKMENGWKRKIEGYKNEPLVEFFYAGFFYEFAIRAWFELQNRWPISPKDSFPFIKNEDQEFFELLNLFMNSTSKERPDVVDKMLARLKASNSIVS